MIVPRASQSAIVIGGGVIGLFTAWRLLDAGFAVTVIDRDRVGGSASWAGGGILSPLPPWQAPEPVWSLAADSLLAYPALAAELLAATGIDPEWTASGMRVLAVADPETALAWAAHSGMAVDVAAAGAAQTATVLHLPWVAQLRSPRLLKALRAYLTGRGVQWLEHTAVTHFDIASGRVRALATATGQRYGSDLVVLCAGAWSGQLAAPLAWTLPVEPVRGQMLRFSAPVGLLSEVVLAGGHYLIPRRDGGILVGSTLEWTGFDSSVTAAAAASLFEVACALLPALRQCEVSHHWAALRPGSEQGIPCIGEAPGISNLFVNSGHFRNGITLAPASAQRLLALIGA